MDIDAFILQEIKEWGSFFYVLTFLFFNRSSWYCFLFVFGYYKWQYFEIGNRYIKLFQWKLCIIPLIIDFYSLTVKCNKTQWKLLTRWVYLTTVRNEKDICICTNFLFLNIYTDFTVKILAHSWRTNCEHIRSLYTY